MYGAIDLYWISPSICHFDFQLFIEKIAGIQSVLDLRGFGVCTLWIIVAMYCSTKQEGQERADDVPLEMYYCKLQYL